jgi:phage-related protein
MVVPTKFTLQDQMTGSLGAIQGKVDKFAAAASSALSRIMPRGGIFSSLAGQVAIGTLAAKGMEKAFRAVRNTIASVPEAAQRFDEIAKTSVRLGMSTDALQKYRYAADMAGVSNEQLNTAFLFLNKGLGNGTLVTALEKIDAGLARQVKAAPDSATAFKIISESMSAEGDIAKRTATMMAAFGKSGNDLVTILPTLSEQLKNAEKYGNIIPHSALVNAELFNDTISRVKSMVQSFGDTIRGSVLQYVTPLLVKLQEWIAANRELIQGKIQEFIQGAARAINNFIRIIKMISPVAGAVWGAIVRITGSLSPLIGRVKDWIEANRGLIETRIQNTVEKISAAVERLVPWISRALEIIIRFAPEIVTFVASLWGLKTVLGAVSGAITAVKTAIALLSNPTMLIILAVAALITGFIILVNKVGGVKEAFIVVGQTIMKYLLTPVNLIIETIQGLVEIAMTVLPTIGSAFTMIGQTIMKVVLTPINFLLTGIDAIISTASNIGSIGEAFRIVGQTIMKFALTPVNFVMDAIGGLLSAIGHIPGADWAKTGADAIQGFQDKMNVALTGSESTFFDSGSRAFLDPAREVMERGEPSAVKKFHDQLNTALTGSASTIASDGLSAVTDPARQWAAGGFGQAERAAGAAVAASINEKIQSAQDAMNTTLTGSTSTVFDSGPKALLEPYRNAREAELKRQEAAREAAGGNDKTDETNDLLRQLVEEERKNTEAVNSLGETGAAGIPARLSYSQMGQEDFFSIVRYGI